MPPFAMVPVESHTLPSGVRFDLLLPSVLALLVLWHRPYRMTALGITVAAFVTIVRMSTCTGPDV